MPIFAGLATLAHIVSDSAVLNLAYAHNDVLDAWAAVRAAHPATNCTPVVNAHYAAMEREDIATHAYAEALVALIPLHTQSYDFQESLHLCAVCVLPHAPSLHVASEYCEWSTREHALDAAFIR